MKNLDNGEDDDEMENNIKLGHLLLFPFTSHMS